MEKGIPDVIDEKEVEYKIEIASQTLDRTIGFVTTCDNKTSIVLASVGVLLTIILTNDGIGKLFAIITNCLEQKTFGNILYFIFLVFSVCMLFYGIFKLASVLIANVSEEADGLKATDSRIFFTGIKNHGNCELFQDKFCAMNRIELLSELMVEIYINANIADQKYKKYNKGFKYTAIGFILFVFIFFIGSYLY